MFCCSCFNYTAANEIYTLSLHDALPIYIALFVGIFGVIALFTPNSKNNSQMGILSLVLVGGVMGVFMTKYNEWVLPSAGKNRKIPWSKLIWGFVLMLAVLFACFWVLAIPAFRVINPVLPGIADRKRVV